jgi:hypothetical protein
LAATGQPHELFAVTATDFGRVTFVSGQVGRDVASVRVLLDGGDRLDLRPVGEEANLSMRFFVTPLDAGERAVEVVALTADGRELHRRAVPAPTAAYFDTGD